MLSIAIKSNFDLSKFNVPQMIDIGLNNSARPLQSIARENAPIDRGKLKQGIGIERGARSARVGPRNIPYGVRREFENKKNPHKKHYMKKTHDVAPPIIEKAFRGAFDIVSKHIST